MAGLGEILEQTRLERGLTLDEAERATHISRRYLHALEAEDYSVFAAPVFTRGFLRTYSQYLGLDPNAALAMLPDSPEPIEPEPEPETARVEFERRTRSMRDRMPRRQNTFGGGAAPGPLTRTRVPAVEPSSPTRVGAAVAGLVVAVFVLGYGASKLGGHGSAGSGPAAAAPSAVNAAAAGSQNQPKATPPPPARKAGTMPNLVGKDQQAAVQQLQQVGITPLVIGLTSANKSDKPGAVLRQEPGAGTALTTNSNVTLVVNQGQTATTPATVNTVPIVATPSVVNRAPSAATPSR
ncbi:MAG: helix-turn-helix domain-containing protein [Dehalococcoidia bacterium]